MAKSLPKSSPQDADIASEDYICPICQCILEQPVGPLPCKHSFCLSCFEHAIEISCNNCPLCRTRLLSWHRAARANGTLIDRQKWSFIRANRRKIQIAIDNADQTANHTRYESSGGNNPDWWKEESKRLEQQHEKRKLSEEEKSKAVIERLKEMARGNEVDPTALRTVLGTDEQDSTVTSTTLVEYEPDNKPKNDTFNYTHKDIQESLRNQHSLSTTRASSPGPESVSLVSSVSRYGHADFIRSSAPASVAGDNAYSSNTSIVACLPPLPANYVLGQSVSDDTIYDDEEVIDEEQDLAVIGLFANKKQVPSLPQFVAPLAKMEPSDQSDHLAPSTLEEPSSSDSNNNNNADTFTSRIKMESDLPPVKIEIEVESELSHPAVISPVHAEPRLIKRIRRDIKRLNVDNEIEDFELDMSVTDESTTSNTKSHRKLTSLKRRRVPYTLPKARRVRKRALSPSCSTTSSDTPTTTVSSRASSVVSTLSTSIKRRRKMQNLTPSQRQEMTDRQMARNWQRQFNYGLNPEDGKKYSLRHVNLKFNK